MLNKTMTWGLGFILVIVGWGLFPVDNQAQLAKNDNFVFINYIGQDLYLDLDDVQYVVPGTATHPDGGRVTLQLSPGEHKYAANVPGVPLGSAGEFTLEPGGYVAKAARLEKTPPEVDQNGILIKKPKDYVFLFDFDPTAPSTEPTPVVDVWRPSPAQAGQGSLVWLNHWGSDELTVDLNGQIYKVPPQQNQLPGRLQIDVSPGFYRYSATVPNGGYSGEINVVAGEVTGLNYVIEREPLEYDEGDKFEYLPPATVKETREDLTALANQSAVSSSLGETEVTETPVITATPQLTTGDLEPLQETTPVTTTGVIVKNFTGDTVIFTINEQAFTVADRAEQRLPIPPGRHNYTASLPGVATTGTVEFAAGEAVELSLAINIARDVLTIYQN